MATPFPSFRARNLTLSEKKSLRFRVATICFWGILQTSVRPPFLLVTMAYMGETPWYTVQSVTLFLLKYKECEFFDPVAIDMLSIGVQREREDERKSKRSNKDLLKAHGISIK